MTRATMTSTLWQGCWSSTSAAWRTPSSLRSASWTWSPLSVCSSLWPELKAWAIEIKSQFLIATHCVLLLLVSSWNCHPKTIACVGTADLAQSPLYDAPVVSLLGYRSTLSTEIPRQAYGSNWDALALWLDWNLIDWAMEAGLGRLTFAVKYGFVKTVLKPHYQKFCWLEERICVNSLYIVL